MARRHRGRGGDKNRHHDHKNRHGHGDKKRHRHGDKNRHRGGRGSHPGGHRGFHFIKGKPGVKNDVIDPFLNASDMQDRLTAQQTMEQTLRDQDSALSDTSTQTAYDKSQIDKQQTFDRRDTSDADAARGLFQSSIRDADLYDIDATAAIRKNFLDRQMDTATLRAQTTKLAATNAWDEFQQTLNQKMVENAQGLNDNMSYWKKNPIKPHWENKNGQEVDSPNQHPGRNDRGRPNRNRNGRPNQNRHRRGRGQPGRDRGRGRPNSGGGNQRRNAPMTY